MCIVLVVRLEDDRQRVGVVLDVVPQDDLVCGWGPGLDGGAVREDFFAELDLGGGDDLALAGPVEDFQDVAVLGGAPTERCMQGSACGESLPLRKLTVNQTGVLA